MGSPLGPLFANIFLSFRERTWLADCPQVIALNRCSIARRYVDDCFLIFQSKEQVTPFIDYLNSKHPNMQLTHELESNYIMVLYHSLTSTSREQTVMFFHFCISQTNLSRTLHQL